MLHTKELRNQHAALWVICPSAHLAARGINFAAHCARHCSKLGLCCCRNSMQSEIVLRKHKCSTHAVGKALVNFTGTLFKTCAREEGPRECSSNVSKTKKSFQIKATYPAWNCPARNSKLQKPRWAQHDSTSSKMPENERHTSAAVIINSTIHRWNETVKQFGGAPSVYSRDFFGRMNT